MTAHCRISYAGPSLRPSALLFGTQLLTCASASWAQLTLRPGEAFGLPADGLPPMAVGIEWPLEAIRDVTAARVAGRRHRLGSFQAALPRATDEEQFAFTIGAEGSDRLDDTFDEGCIETVVRKALPFDQHGPLADGRQIRKADVGPFRNRPHIDEYRPRVTLQPRPRILDGNSGDVDSTHVSLHQRRLKSCAGRNPGSQQYPRKGAACLRLDLGKYRLLEACSQTGKKSERRTLGQPSDDLRSPTREFLCFEARLVPT